MTKSLFLTASLALAAFAVNAAVPSGWSVNPTPNSTVEEIKVIKVTNNSGYLDPYINRVIKIDGVGYSFTTKKEGNMDQTLVFTLNDAYTTPGEHQVVIPEGVFTYGLWDEEDNPEISFSLTIEGEEPTPPEPGEFTPIDNPNFEITPPQGEVAQIYEFNVKYLHTGLCPEGNSTIKTILIDESTNETVATFNIEDGGGLYDVMLSLPEPFTTPGSYIISMPEGSVYDSYDNDWPAAQFRYVIKEGLTPEVPQETVYATPVNESTVSFIDEILLYFPDIFGVYATGPNKDGVTVKKNGQPYEVAASFDFDSLTMEDGEIGLVFEPALTETGAYEIYVPARALTLATGIYDSRWNDEFTLTYDVEGVLSPGDKIKVAPLTYKVVSGVDRTLSVTWPSKESEYNGVTEVPSTVEYNGEIWTVVEIGKLAFSDVKGIGSITVPETVTVIGEGAFWESSLSGIQLPSTLTTIESDAFNASNLKTLTIPESVVNFGEDICYQCEALEEINFPSNLTEVPDGFANGCTMIESVVLPSGVKRIGEFAFSEAQALSSINLPEGLEAIERFAFAYCLELKNCPVPSTLNEVGHGVFYQSGITSASLPDAITVIPDGMYQCCASLPEFHVNDTVTEIEREAFYWCFAMTKIYLGSGLQLLGDDVFKGDRALTEITSAALVPPTGAKFEDEVYQNATLYVPAESIADYRAAEGWKQFLNIQSIDGSNVAGPEAEESIVTLYDAMGRKVFSGKMAEAPEGLFITEDGKKILR